MTTYGPHESECCVALCAARCCLTAAQHKHFHETGESFYCSAGHAQRFSKSVNDQLREKIAALEQRLERERKQVEYFRSRVQEERDTWRCPFAGCYMSTRSRGGLVGHIRARHVTRAALLLAADAGPDALNTRVDSERVA